MSNPAKRNYALHGKLCFAYPLWLSRRPCCGVPNYKLRVMKTVLWSLPCSVAKQLGGYTAIRNELGGLDDNSLLLLLRNTS